MKTHISRCRSARSWQSLLGASLLAASPVGAGLAAYDNKIAADHAAGLPYLAISTTTFTFDTTNSEPFDFGAVSGSSTLEFILAGDPVGGGQDAYLAVGSNSTWNLRYEQWNDTGVLGFTHLGVADYVFSPPVVAPENPLSDSPTELTHVTYRWDQASTTMELYINGELAGINASATGFQMPTGAGFLGNNPGNTEGMAGTMERVTIYNEAVAPATILAHADAWNGPGGSLANYDSVIAADHAGALPYSAVSSAALTFNGTDSSPFDFGAISGSATIEFIVTGDPVASGQSAFLAVGSNGTWSLRYEQWNDTGKLGFTHGGVADYQFLPANLPPTPSLQSPTELTHVVYRWDQPTTTMELYLDGVLAGTNPAATAYQMPTGAGLLGNNAAGSEGMLGVIERVTVYNEAISPDAILAHARAWLGVQELTLVVTSDGSNLTFRWPSQSGKVYDLLSDTDLVAAPATWPVFDGHEALPATPDESTLTIPRPVDPERFFVIQERPAPPIFFEEFESETGWTAAVNDLNGNTAWERGAPANVGPSSGANGSATCFGTNIAANYGIGADIVLRSPPIDLTDPEISGARLGFQQFRDIEAGFDAGSVRILRASDSVQLGADLATTVDGVSADWEESSFNLPPEAIGEAIIIEFQFTSDELENFAGWYLDDVAVSVN